VNLRFGALVVHEGCVGFWVKFLKDVGLYARGLSLCTMELVPMKVVKGREGCKYSKRRWGGVHLLNKYMYFRVDF
jgi:hypothetical protein